MSTSHWAQKFQAVSAGQRTADFGTVAGGLYTFAELKDILAAKDPVIDSLTHDFQKFAPTWALKDPAGLADFQKDYQALIARYNKARDDAHKTISGAGWDPLPDNLIVGDPEYVAVMKAIQQDWSHQGPGFQKKGDLVDLINRLNAAGAASTIPAHAQQPSPHADADMDFFRHPLDAIGRGLSGTAQGTTKTWQWVAQEVDDADKALAHFSIPWWKIALIGLAALFGVAMIAKSTATVAAKLPV